MRSIILTYTLTMLFVTVITASTHHHVRETYRPSAKIIVDIRATSPATRRWTPLPGNAASQSGDGPPHVQPPTATPPPGPTDIPVVLGGASQ